METLAEDVLDTIQSSPDETIVPADLKQSARALALLQELAGATAITSLSLTDGAVIGEGGMGIVRAAEQVALGRVVAVKTLKAERRRDPASALDLLREAWVTGTVEHPNVVPVHYVGAESDGTPLIVMKRIEGVEWSKLIANAPEVERRFGATDLLAWNLGILMQVLNALRFAHHRGIVHRDLKPANVMIGDFGEVYLLDWGIAVSMRDDGSGRLPLVAHANALAGTPCYMAPEMLGRDHGPRISERTDVYLAGAVLFEVVSGRPPHVGASALEVLASVIDSKPVLPAHVPGDLARIITRAMGSEPEGRHESVDALRIELQRYLERRGSVELAARALERTEQLLVAIAKGGVERDEIYRMFGAVRFGFHEALSVWRDNGDAKAGLARATIAVAELEIEGGNPHAAVTLLSDLDEPPPLLARAKAAAGERSRREQAADQLLEANDPTRGRRTRVLMIAILGPIFVVAPTFAALVPQFAAFSLRNHVLFSLLACLAMVALVLWARDTMTATVLNRRVGAGGILMFGAEALLVGGMWIAGANAYQAHLAVMFMWGMCAAWLAVSLHPWFAPGGLGYFAAFLVSARWPELQLYATSVANLVFTVNLLSQWKPATWMMTREERAWLDARAQARRERQQRG